MAPKNFPLYIGETWTIDGVAMQADGTPLDLTSGSVEVRIVQGGALKVKATASPDVVITDAANGKWTFNLAANDSRQASVAAGDCSYEIDAIDASGGVTVQNAGTILLKTSLRKQFP